MKSIRRLLAASVFVVIQTSLALAGGPPPPARSPAPTFDVLALVVLGGISLLRRRGRK